MIDIYGTLGPSCNSQDVLREMFCSGMTGIRLNLSHISLRESERQLDVFFTAALHAGVEPLLLIDMQGPELRIGRLQAPLMLCEGQTAVLFDEEMGEAERLSLRRQGGAAVPIPRVVYETLDVGEEILLDDGRLLLRASEKSSGRVGARIERGGMLSGRKSIKVVGADIHPPTMTAADRMNIRDAARFGVTGIMQPFVRTGRGWHSLRAFCLSAMPSVSRAGIWATICSCGDFPRRRKKSLRPAGHPGDISWSRPRCFQAWKTARFPPGPK